MTEVAIMDIISMHQAKSSLSQLVKRAEAGERIYIGAYGRAQAVLGPVAETAVEKKIGLLAAKLIVPGDFDDPLPDDVLVEFE